MTTMVTPSELLTAPACILTKKDLEIAALVAQLEANGRQMATLRADLSRSQEAEQSFSILTNSRAWAFVQFLRRIRLVVAPPGSVREKIARWGINFVRSPRRQAKPIGLPSQCDILCLPIIPWRLRFQRPQQLMRQFAQQGHRVFYVSPHFVEGMTSVCNPIEENVYDLQLHGQSDVTVYRDAFPGDMLEIALKQIEEVRLSAGMGAAAIIIQLPFWTPLAEELRKRFGWPIIYDCMDHHEGFAGTSNLAADIEKRLFAEADLTVVSSDMLQAKASAQANDVVVIRNAADYEHFAQSAAPAKDWPMKVGYYGAIAEWFDVELVAELARLHPDWHFQLIGGTARANLASLHGMNNVEILGEKPYDDLPRYVAAWDCCIIPFKRIPLTEATNPVKIYEMLAAGKPIVAVDLPELRPIADAGLVEIANDATEFARKIEFLVDQPAARTLRQRRAFALENTWNRRFRDLDTAMRPLYPKASILVLFHNNLELNRLCVESIFRNTEWPNFELVIIDNASTDGSRAFAEAVAARHDNVRLVLNDQNESFARANNLGLEASSGEFVVFLNNDTIVTHGWLTRLLRHLQVDPTIGMVGPVTNAIGNEAKIDVPYTALEDIPDFARQRTREHDGQAFDIKVLALFCTAMKRSLYEAVGRLDERFGVGMFEDDDLAMRVKKAGFRVVCAEDVFIHHFHGATFKLLDQNAYRSIFEENKRKYEEKWGTWQPHRYREKAAEMSEIAAYTGTDLLETMAEARNYNAFLLGEVLRHGKAVMAVDFGAGCGTFSRALRGQGLEVVCIELDPTLRQRLQEQGFVCHADLAGLAEASADFIFSLNVLEHIEDDEAALAGLFRRLKPGGRVYLYVPAFPLLYSSMDRKVGHFRRYRLAGIKKKLTAAGFRIADARYADSLGFLVSLLYRFIGSREGEINPRTLAFYDRVLFPISRILDRLVGRWLGKNVGVAAYRPIATAAVPGDARRAGRVAA